MNNKYTDIIRVYHKEQNGFLRYFTNPRKDLETDIGCYFIYGDNDELLYVGKSNTGLLNRARSSAKERATTGFSRIELVEFDTKADTSIYEIYYITHMKPKLNKESSCQDIPSFELPDIGRHFNINLISEKKWYMDAYYTNCQHLKSELYDKNIHLLYNDRNLNKVHNCFKNAEIPSVPTNGNIVGEVFEVNDTLCVFHLSDENKYSQNEFKQLIN